MWVVSRSFVYALNFNSDCHIVLLFGLGCKKTSSNQVTAEGDAGCVWASFESGQNFSIPHPGRGWESEKRNHFDPTIIEALT